MRTVHNKIDAGPWKGTALSDAVMYFDPRSVTFSGSPTRRGLEMQKEVSTTNDEKDIDDYFP